MPRPGPRPDVAAGRGTFACRLEQGRAQKLPLIPLNIREQHMHLLQPRLPSRGDRTYTREHARHHELHGALHRGPQHHHRDNPGDTIQAHGGQALPSRAELCPRDSRRRDCGDRRGRHSLGRRDTSRGRQPGARGRDTGGRQRGGEREPLNRRIRIREKERGRRAVCGKLPLERPRNVQSG